MNERRIKGRIVGVDNTLDDVYFTLELEEDEANKRNKRGKKRRVSIPVPRAKYGVVALLDAAFLKGCVVSMTTLHEERSDVMLVYKVKDVKIEDGE